MRKYLIICLACICWLGSNGGIDPIFDHYSTDDGLSNGNVSAMLQDKKGFMWFATWDGINRYDGKYFKSFHFSRGEDGIPVSGRVESMQEDDAGNIWVKSNDENCYRFNRYSESFEQFPTGDRGEKIPRVHSILNGANGDVWLVMVGNGVVRVETDIATNNVRQEYFSKENGLLGNEISFYGFDESKNLWLDTDGGLVCLERNRNLNTYKPKLLNAQEISVLKRDRISVMREVNGKLYFGTLQGRLIVLDRNRQIFRTIEIENDKPITDMLVGDNGLLFIGTAGNGLLYFDSWKEEVIQHYTEPSVLHVLGMYCDSKGMLWIESLQKGIAKINLQSGEFKRYEQSLIVAPDLRSTAQCGFMEDGEQTLWLTLKGGGFGRYNIETDELEYFYNDPDSSESRFSNFVSCFYIDPEGVLWMSTYFKGIEKVSFVDKKFRLVQPAGEKQFSMENEVRALLEVKGGDLWVASKSGAVFIYDAKLKLKEKVTELNGDPIGRVYCMLQDSAGRIYLGTKGNGLFRISTASLNRAKVEHFIHKENDRWSLPNDNLYCMLEDGDGVIWLGSYGGGLVQMDGERFIHSLNDLSTYPIGTGASVRHMIEDHDGNLWVGTTGGLVIGRKLAERKRTFAGYSRELANLFGLRSNDIFWIEEDESEQIWLASFGSGLAKLTTVSSDSILDFDVILRDNGLSGDVVYSIQSDRVGNLWLSGENGVARFGVASGIIENYNESDGLQSLSFSEGASVVLQDGSICFGATNGFYHFNPAVFLNVVKPVNLVFTKLELFGQEQNAAEADVLKRSMVETTELNLKYNQNSIGIYWATLDFKQQGELRYEYRLVGYDEDWRYGANQFASYSKLEPGDYLFQVRLNNSEVQLDNDLKELRVHISPPYWQTTWAYLLYAAVFILVLELIRRTVITMIRLRNEVVIEQKMTELKLSFFTNISHELRTPLTLILGPSEELDRNEKLSRVGKEHVRLIKDNASRLLRLVNQLLVFRKIQHEQMFLDLKETELNQFVGDVCCNFEELAKERQILFRVELLSEPVIAKIDRDKIDSVLYNLLANASRFTPNKGRISVVLRREALKNRVWIDVCDNGPGVHEDLVKNLFQPFKSGIQPGYSGGTGIGLALSKELVNLHGGQISYRRAVGGGALFSFCLSTNVVEMESDNAYESIVAEAEDSESEVKTHQARWTDGFLRILVVEDNIELRRFLELQLVDEYIVELAENGMQALELIQKQQPDLILSDVMMPEMDGIQLLDILKSDFNTSHIPVVLLTARSSIDSKIKALRYGADAYLTKPFNTDQLKAQLENLLIQRRQLRKRFSGISFEEESGAVLKITDADSRFLEQVQEVIQENLSNSKFKVAEIYETIGMGKSKFFEKLRALTGLSPVEFIRSFRLAKASELLRTGDYIVGEVGFMTGFSDAGYFSKCFKEQFGMTPSQFVKKTARM